MAGAAYVAKRIIYIATFIQVSLKHILSKGKYITLEMVLTQQMFWKKMGI